MAALVETVAARLAGRTVRVAHLIELDFASAAERIWTGFGSLTAGGETWQGIGDAGQVGSVSTSAGLRADPVRLTLSGLSPGLVAIAKDQVAEVVGRRVTIYLQFFDDAWATLDTPVAIFAGRMDRMSLVRSADSAVIEVNCEPILVTKHRPAFGNFSHFDQQQRFSGDLGLERMAHNVNNTVAWP